MNEIVIFAEDWKENVRFVIVDKDGTRRSLVIKLSDCSTKEDFKSDFDPLTGIEYGDLT